MRTRIAVSAACLFLVVAAAILTSQAQPNKNVPNAWPQWRGPLASGVAPEGNPPVEWSEQKNVAWRVTIPGKGSATPIIWGNMVFVQTAVPSGKPAAPPAEAPPEGAAPRRGLRGISPSEVLQFMLLAIDRETGRLLWQRTLREEKPHEGTHPTGTWASNSPVTDGETVFAYFGSRGLYAVDMKGTVKWERDFGDMSTRNSFGEGSSPALHGNTLIVNWDHEGESFIVAVDKRSGKDLWRQPRDEMTSWSTPLIVEHHGAVQVVVSATNRVRSYDLATGNLLWESRGMTANAIPSPVFADGRLFVTSGFRGNALLAIRLEAARGDISDSAAILWRLDRDTPYVPSPLLYGNQLYFLKSNSGILSVYEAASGKPLYSQVRIEGVPNVYASPVGAAGRVYIAGREGATAVLAHGPEFKLLSINQLDDGFDASPAVAGDALFLRGLKHLYKIASR